VRRLPVLVQQVLKRDPTALGDTAKSQRTEELRPRTEKADRIVKSLCPYCGVGCGQLVYVKDERITNIEGDPDSPISEGCLCPKGAATRQLVVGSHRANQVLYRKPGGTTWEPIALETAMEMVTARVIATRDATWQVSYFGNTCELATGQSADRFSSFLRSIMRCPRAVYCTIPCRRRKLRAVEMRSRRATTIWAISSCVRYVGISIRELEC